MHRYLNEKIEKKLAQIRKHAEENRGGHVAAGIPGHNENSIYIIGRIDDSAIVQGSLPEQMRDIAKRWNYEMINVGQKCTRIDITRIRGKIIPGFMEIGSNIPLVYEWHYAFGDAIDLLLPRYLRENAVVKQLLSD